MSNKIVSPFTGIFTEPPNALRIWLGQNKDSFDNFEDTHKDTRLSVKTQAQGLLLAGGLEDRCDGEVLLVHTGLLVPSPWEPFPPAPSSNTSSSTPTPNCISACLTICRLPLQIHPVSQRRRRLSSLSRVPVGTAVGNLKMGTEPYIVMVTGNPWVAVQ
ncbi:hypothetical protein FA13DRAFT_1710217 [Coprinellus micaceus]|uniref:Uncharacterized protein n=1 Tax=Coprinellus micaceus TaxID=71717 RepID=A0A4Y7T8N4_COPMI|nr:hypothetical protein FA13DRAFT_1710217 [Coprinellus micaceus]